jgi:hypothetical protein
VVENAVEQALALDAACVVAVGPFSVETADSVSGIPSWDTVMTRIETEWKRRNTNKFKMDGWQLSVDKSVWRGPTARFL